MNCKRLLAVLVAATAVAVYAGTVLATPGVGFTSTTLAQGHVDPLNLITFPGRHTPWQQRWGLILKTFAASDLYVQSNVWTPGGSSGWHTHPGPSLITVTAGTVTAYEGDDPSCTPHVYSTGQTFVDPGGGHVHLIRNEGTVEARSITVQLIPAGRHAQDRRAGARQLPLLAQAEGGGRLPPPSRLLSRRRGRRSTRRRAGRRPGTCGHRRPRCRRSRAAAARPRSLRSSRAPGA